MILYTCDVCHQTLDPKKEHDIFEIQEFIKIRHRCGFTSVFGDLNFLSIDICQKCFMMMLKKAKVDITTCLDTTEPYQNEPGDRYV